MALEASGRMRARVLVLTGAIGVTVAMESAEASKETPSSLNLKKVWRQTNEFEHEIIGCFGVAHLRILAPEQFLLSAVA